MRRAGFQPVWTRAEGRRPLVWMGWAGRQSRPERRFGDIKSILEAMRRLSGYAPTPAANHQARLGRGLGKAGIFW